MDPPKKAPLRPAPVTAEVPLLPTTAKAKEETKTYVFRLKLGESNDRTYPEFSWKDLVRDANLKKAAAVAEKKSATGAPGLDPYASDDDDALKAMAARFEDKYGKGNPSPSQNIVRKRKRQAEDYIDRGAGYDESDSFIDNTEVYDEVVPEDLQTVHGGFYINSGALEYKEAEVSEGEVEDTSKSQDPVKHKKILKKSSKSKPPQLKPENLSLNASTSSTKTQNVHKKAPGHPRKLLDGSEPAKKRRDSTSSQLKRTKRKVSTEKPAPVKEKDGVKPNNASVELVKKETSVVNISSSSTSESSSSEDDSSNSSSGSGSESSEDEVTKKKKLIKATIFRKSATTLSASNLNNKPLAVNPARRLKVKNVPLNPKLHGINTFGTPLVSTSLPTLTPAPVSAALSNRDIFSSSSTSSAVKLNSLPAGLTVTANVGPPKLSPSVGSIIGARADLKAASSSGVRVNPINSKPNPKKVKPPRLSNSFMNMNLTSPGSSITASTKSATIKHRKPKPQTAAQQLQSVHQQLLAATVNNAKYGGTSSAVAAFQNYQLQQQQSATLAVLAGLRPPFPPTNEVKRKRTSRSPAKSNAKFSANNAISYNNSGATMNQLGTAITVTEVKERSHQSSSPANNSAAPAFSSKRLDAGNGRSRTNSPVNSASISRLPNAITITASPGLNLSTSGSGSSRHATQNLTPPNSGKNIKVTPHDVNSLLGKRESSSNSLLSNSTQSLMEKMFAMGNGTGVLASRDSQRK